MGFLSNLFGGGKKVDYSPVKQAHKDAATISQTFTDNAIDELENFYGIVDESGKNWREIAKQSTETLLQDLQDGSYTLEQWDGNFTQEQLEADEGYRFRLREGEKAIQRGAAAAGNRFSGETQKALLRHGQELSSQEYQAARQRAIQDHQIRNGIIQGNFANNIGLAQNAQNYTNLNNQALGAITGSQIDLLGQNAQVQGNSLLGQANTGVQQTIANNQRQQARFANGLALGKLFGSAASGIGGSAGGAASGGGASYSSGYGGYVGYGG